MKVITNKEYSKLKKKANSWDGICNAIAEFYEDYDDNGNEIPPQKDGDLCDIGLVAAEYTGYL